MASAPSSTTHPPSPSTSTPHPDPPHTTKPFRFKRKPKTTSPSSPNHDPSTHRHRRHHHRYHHRSHRSPPAPNSPPPSPPLDPDTAFRESLFDAMADDEGAAYWESVYGQPVHTYAHYYNNNNNNNNNVGSDADAKAEGEGPKGGKENVQTMTEDEYVTFVRRNMWERSYGYVFEERERRREQMRINRNRNKKRKAGEDRGREDVEDEDSRDWQRGVEEALRRGEERRRMKKREEEEGRWRVVWRGYVRGWEGMRWGGGENDDHGAAGLGEGKAKGKSLRERIPWPVESGKWQDVEKDGVEKFLSQAPTAAAAREDQGGSVDLGEVLKKERIRWHPDKMQQRAGEGGIDAETLKLVTAVFQVVDRMWGEVKRKKTKI